jgi:hypothetical protein
MELHPNNTNVFIMQCRQNARGNFSQEKMIGGASTNWLQQVFVCPRQGIEAQWFSPLSHIHLLMANVKADKKQESIGFLENSNTLHGTVVDANGTSNLQQVENGI